VSVIVGDVGVCDMNHESAIKYYCD